MLVRDVMTEGTECIQPSDSLQKAAQRMKNLNVGSLPVCGDNNRLVGLITDRDITVRAVAEAYDAHRTTVKDIMTPDVLYCFEDQDVQDAAQLMKERQIRRLAVLNRDKRLTGIVSLGDLAVDTGDEQLAGETLERISEPA